MQQGLLDYPLKLAWRKRDRLHLSQHALQPIDGRPQDSTRLRHRHSSRWGRRAGCSFPTAKELFFYFLYFYFWFLVSAQRTIKWREAEAVGIQEWPMESKSLQGEKGLLEPCAADHYIPLCV